MSRDTETERRIGQAEPRSHMPVVRGMRVGCTVSATNGSRAARADSAGVAVPERPSSNTA